MNTPTAKEQFRRRGRTRYREGPVVSIHTELYPRQVTALDAWADELWYAGDKDRGSRGNLIREAIDFCLAANRRNADTDDAL